MMEIVVACLRDFFQAIILSWKLCHHLLNHPKLSKTPLRHPYHQMVSKHKSRPTTPPVNPLPLPLAPSLPPVGDKNSLNVYMIVGIVVGVSTISGALITFFLIFSRNISIKPWTNSSQLQDALISDIPRLQLSELRTTCKDFSNIIGSFSDGAIYKGTLSTSAEIAVVSIAAGSRVDWSNAMETQLLQKMHKLFKVDHKNFLNLIDYCHEEVPFNRMLASEYAPNGSLFEHLHWKDFISP